tara:strand:+ start:199 stop:462 length:264 start_codon:yes stop_codon:yes gene_type:complete
MPYYVEYGEYSFPHDCVIWNKKECDKIDHCIEFIRYHWNTLIYTSLNQITFIEGDNKYDWDYIKNNSPVKEWVNLEYECCGFDPAIP